MVSLERVVSVFSDFLFGSHTRAEALKHESFIKYWYPYNVSSPDNGYYIPLEEAVSGNRVGTTFVPLTQKALNCAALCTGAVMVYEGFDVSTSLYVSSPFLVAKSFLYSVGRLAIHAGVYADVRTFDRLAGVLQKGPIRTVEVPGRVSLEVHDSPDTDPADWWKQGVTYDGFFE